jgi:hypothetical protein
MVIRAPGVVILRLTSAMILVIGAPAVGYARNSRLDLKAVSMET